MCVVRWQRCRAERASMDGEKLPSFAQVWAVGFMYAVESWPEEWVAPRDKDAQKWLDGALEAIVALTEDDTDEPTLSVFERWPAQRECQTLQHLCRCGVGGLRPARTLAQCRSPCGNGRKEAEPGRNDPCPCGSGEVQEVHGT